ncbi:zinc finger MYM-type protein 1-like [Solenopsis invicta]|uniref:zinc finger MYM-type protein 1-like n=1 Tax=Solenopsis invicta TaxID=13686 RepID=UPI00193E46CA|nr:zinc finger MYM-type protein 1-like [Solenopsis invicta]
MDKYLLKKSKQPNLNVELATSFSLDAFNNNMLSTSATNATSKLTSNSKKSTFANARSVSSILDVSEEKNKPNELLLSLKSVRVVQYMSVANQKTMMENRIALKKIFCTIRVLALQGSSLRGNGSNKRSNFNEILQARSEDILELRAWLHRKGHKWTSHDIQNEILELMASNIKIVSDNLSIREIFWGFYDTKNTKSETIYALVKHVFAECGLDMKKLRGQCYDGASNVSGKISGLQTHICKEEPRAVFVHCNAHRLNLVVQDARCYYCQKLCWSQVGIKDLITFIWDSPKRLAEYKGFQEAVLKEDDEENLGKVLTIAPYCPTRWCMRVFSLKRLQQKINYMAALQFLGAMKMNRKVDSSKIELLNKELQESNLCALDSHRKVDAVMISLEAMRDSKFELIWKKSKEGAEVIGLEEPKLKRPRTVSKHIDSNFNKAHTFKTPKEYYSRMYYEVFDRVLMSLKERFETSTLSHFDELETFSIGGDIDKKNIIDFYGDDFEEEKLLRDRQMFLDIIQRKNVQLRHVKDVVTYFENNDWCAALVSEYFKLIQLLTVPGSTCTNEQSFSSLRRLNTSTMLQDRLNNIAILHVHYGMTKKLDLDNVNDPDSQLIQWRHKLEKYDYEVIYRAGKRNASADALSRNPSTSQVNSIKQKEKEYIEEEKKQLLYKYHNAPRRASRGTHAKPLKTGTQMEGHDKRCGKSHRKM